MPLKKILLFLLLLSSLYAESKIYMGANYGFFDEEFTTNTGEQSSSQSLGLKIGYGEREAYAIELNLQRSENESKIFSNNDDIKYSINVELVKSFDFGIYINPFFKAGFGTGTMEIQRELQDRIHFGSLNLGAGAFIPLNEHFDLELGYDYKSISYQDVDYISQRISYESNMNTLYVGFNVRF